MAKRRPGTELNHDNWEEEEEPEEKGEFRMASESELSKRVIKTAKRRNPGDKPASAAAASVFGGFAGFTSGTTASSGSAAPSSIFAFLSQDKKPDTNGTAAKHDQPEKTASTTTDTTTDKTYHQKLSALNKSLTQWISKHVDDNPICILTPIFKDYEKHLLEIQVAKSEGSKSTASSPSATGPTTTTSASTTTFQGFSFGSGAAAASTPVTTSPPKPTSTFSFGSAAGATAAPLVPSASTGFSFGGAKPFSFGNTGPVVVTPAAPKETTDENNDDDEDQPPKVEFTPVVEEDSVFSKRCKVFFKVDNNFQERGIGTIFVKPIKDSAKHQMIVRADTSLGNILVNVVLAPGLPVKKMGSNNVMLVCIPNTDFDKPVSVLFKVKTAADADEVVEKLSKFTTE